MSFIKEKLEKMGIYIFCISLLMFTQINWAKNKHSYDDIELRIFFAVVLGFGLSILISDTLKKIISKSDNRNIEDVLAKISFSLSPGFLFLFASNNILFLYLGFGFSVLMILNSFLSPPKGFINILEINDGVAEIKVEGIYQVKNSSALKTFLDDFILNLNECIEENAREIKVNFSSLENSDGKELRGMMDEVAKYFNLELSY